MSNTILHINNILQNSSLVKNILGNERFKELVRKSKGRFGLMQLIGQGLVDEEQDLGFEPNTETDNSGGIPIGGEMGSQDSTDPNIRPVDFISNFFGILPEESKDEEMYWESIGPIRYPSTILVRFDDIEDDCRYGFGVTSLGVSGSRQRAPFITKEFYNDKIVIEIDNKDSKKRFLNKGNYTSSTDLIEKSTLKYLGLRIDEYGNIGVGQAVLFWTTMSFTKIGNINSFPSFNIILYKQYESEGSYSIDGEFVGYLYDELYDGWGSITNVPNNGEGGVFLNDPMFTIANPELEIPLPTGSNTFLDLLTDNGQFFSVIIPMTQDEDFFFQTIPLPDTPSIIWVQFRGLTITDRIGLGVSVKDEDPVRQRERMYPQGWWDNMIGVEYDLQYSRQTNINQSNMVSNEMVGYSPVINILLQIDQYGNIGIVSKA